MMFEHSPQTQTFKERERYSYLVVMNQDIKECPKITIKKMRVNLNIFQIPIRNSLLQKLNREKNPHLYDDHMII